jgi:hypothetical protein
LIGDEEIRATEEMIKNLRKAMNEEQAYYQKVFEDNSGNIIDCSVGAPTVPPTTPSLNDLPENSLADKEGS